MGMNSINEIAKQLIAMGVSVDDYMVQQFFLQDGV